MPIPACMQLRMLIQTPNVLITNMYYYTGTPAPTTLAELRVIGNAISDHIRTPLCELYGEQTILLGSFCSYQTGSGSALEDQTANGAVGGNVHDVVGTDEDSNESDELPSEVALIVKKLTGLAGRAKRGRWFYGGLSEQVSHDGAIHQDYRNKILAVCGAVVSDVTVAASGTYAGGTWHSRHWDRKNNVLEPISVARAIVTFGTRRDRRAPKPTNIILA